jgi:hypothetical protein
VKSVRTIQVAGLGELPLNLTVPESQPITRLGRDATYAAIERGDLHAVRVGRRIVIPTIPLLRQYGLEVDHTTPGAA